MGTITMTASRGLLALACAAALLSRADVAAAQRAPTSADDSAAVARTVASFHAALASGDSTSALALLADSVLVLESGELETRAEYRAKHLAADIEFSRAVHSERRTVRVTVMGDAAWMVATSDTRGSFRGNEINSAGAELMVLARGPAGWRITAIHWSSHRRRG